jgi:hypothetical protein
MKNKSVEFFNLSFLDLLSGALASVIFLFIIVPKGEPVVLNSPVAITYDTLQNKFYGMMPDSLWNMEEGDSLLAIIGKLEANPEDVRSFARMEVPELPKPKPPVQRKPKKTVKEEKPVEQKEEVKEQEEEKAEPKPTPKITESKFTGSKPDVPCVLSIEVKWENKKDNVNLFVCKDNDCVFGGRRYRSFIGQWDSGKARTSLFGGDLRTNQEAVRQFDELLPGTYEILAQYKESPDPKDELPVRLQVYTKNEEGVERGDEHYFTLSLDPSGRVLIAKLIVGPDGEIDFQTLK